jgi:hypothetical protein
MYSFRSCVRQSAQATWYLWRAVDLDKMVRTKKKSVTMKFSIER